MASRNPRLDLYDPKTLEGMDQAFAVIWARATDGKAHATAAPPGQGWK
jgi:hypothetical protein